MYLSRKRTCVCWLSRAGLLRPLSSPSFSLLAALFYPSLMPTHTQGCCHKQVRGLMQKEAAEAGELTHPCPCP